jgi:D-hexose-6-phosphate mutarotase
MNNINLINLINLYGGNDESNKYTSSLLSKYYNIEEKTTFKINNLETLLIDYDNDSNSEFKNISNNVEDSETFTEFVSKIII